MASATAALRTSPITASCSAQQRDLTRVATCSAPGLFHPLCQNSLLRSERRLSPSLTAGARRQPAIIQAVASVGAKVPVEEWNAAAKLNRLKHLEEQALDTLQKTLANFERPTFPCALIAGDVVILDLLSKLGAFKDGKLKVVFIDTFHLYEESYTFLKECEERYGFKAEVFHAADCSSRADYVEKFGSDLFIRDIDEYDRICKIEPFGRALKTLQVDAMINGRRRDHGAERAHLEAFEAGGMVKVQPLAYWEFRDCFDYLEQNNVPAHPLHSQGYPSIGDVHSTVPVPKENWFEYGGERSGRFQGLKNKDGSVKTECGIHVGDAREAVKA